MADFKLEPIAEGVDKGDVGAIHVKEGDTLQPDQVVLEVETDKAVIEVRYPGSGRVTRLLVKPGETVKVGQPLFQVEDGASEKAPAKGKKDAPKPPAEKTEKSEKTVEKPTTPAAKGMDVDEGSSKPKPQPAASGGTAEFKLEPIAEGVDKGDVGAIHVKEGDTIEPDQVVLEVETDKAVIEVRHPGAGKVKKVLVKPGETVKVGQALLLVESAGAPEKEAPEKPAKETAAPSKPEPSRPEKEAEAPAPKPHAAARMTEDDDKRAPAPAGPATRRLARELGVDLHAVKGTGPRNRITPEDVQAYVRERLKAPAGGAVAGSLAIPPLPDFSQHGPVERQQMNKLSRVSAANLSLSWQVVPHVTQHELVDITELEAGRKRLSQRNESAPKVTMTVLAMKAVVTVLKAFPQFNSSFDANAGEVILKKFYHLGVAVDTEQGLVVPVIKDVDRKSLLELAAELADLSARARARKLQIPEMQGGTFTITNLGGIGGSFFTPIVNYPEVAILGISRSTQQYTVIDGKPEMRLMLPLSLSYDHRVVNGADAARFIVKLAGLLADPFKLLSEV